MESGRLAGSETPRTLVLADGRTLRLAGIEPIAALFADPAAKAAAAEVLLQRLGALQAGSEIGFSVIADEPDRYGRLPALVVIDDLLLQETLVGEGLAVAFALGAPFACFDALLAAEQDARRRGRGFWADAAVPFAAPNALAERTGLLTIFEGNVLSVGNRKSRTYLNFGWRWSEDVTVEILAADRDGFGGEAGLALVAGRRVRVRGVLADRNGPLLTVRSPMQIEFLPQPDGVDGEAP